MGWTFVAGTAISSAFVPSPCSPITWIRPPPASTPGLITTRSPTSKPLTPSPSVLDDTRPVGSEDARLRHGRQPLADPDVEMVQRRGAQADEHLACSGLRVGRLLEHQHLGAAVLVDPHRAHRGRLSV